MKIALARGGDVFVSTFLGTEAALGPRLPAPAAVAEIDKKNTAGGLREQAGIEPGDDAKTVLKKLLKPKVKPE
ncbi:MAG: hypothetical protein E6Q99_09540 [Elusimicrobia bacterium]|jgi:hypothetical protein|nr:MAG: hypothetical protein E6Q99_09540 [Elusimicrobiota bacterium]